MSGTFHKLLLSVLVATALPAAAWARVWGLAAAGPAGRQGRPGPDNGSSVCDTRDCGQRCCVRVRKKVRVKVHGKWRTRYVLRGWKCYTGPEAVETCRRRR